MSEPTGHHRQVVESVKRHTGCSHEEAGRVLGEITEILQRVHMGAYNAGALDAYRRGERRKGDSGE